MLIVYAATGTEVNNLIQKLDKSCVFLEETYCRHGLVFQETISISGHVGKVFD